ncbi:MAG: Cof-type HAD-IIB family hydrolase [Lachnospiraceae bacterium]|nr:Cof-type HAD-IIB family hydrolase [Lachnospiraceae bacterium]
MKKIVFFDIDGTLWDEEMQIPETTKIAIKKLREHGHKAFLCSGRAKANICDPKLMELNFDGIIAACGNHVEMNGKILHENILSLETVRLIYDVTRKYHLPIVLEGPKKQWLDEEGFEGDSYITYIKSLKDTSVMLREFSEDIYVNKFSALIGPQTNYEAVKEALLPMFDFLEHGQGVVEMIPKGTSKATGIAWLCDYLGIANEDTYAVGDSVNDLDMLQFVGHGIAMGNASDIAKQSAEYVTTSLEEDGIYHALEHYGLI